MARDRRGHRRCDLRHRPADHAELGRPSRQRHLLGRELTADAILLVSPAVFVPLLRCLSSVAALERLRLQDEANKSGYYVTPTASGASRTLGNMCPRPLICKTVRQSSDSRCPRTGVGVMFLAEAAMGTPHLITKDSSKAQRFSD